jgi:hypothetical protein
MKDQIFALREGQLDPDSGPEAVSSLGHNYHKLYFYLRRKLTGRLRANTLKEFERVFNPPYSLIGFVASNRVLS